MLSLKPFTLAPDAWCYEQKGGLEVYFDCPGKGPMCVAIIPWSKLKGAIRRKEAAP